MCLSFLCFLLVPLGVEINPQFYWGGRKSELISSARNGAKTEHSVDILTKLEELDKRLKVLENFEAPSDSTEETVEEYVVGKWYYKGDKVFFEGEAYVCTAPEDTVCVWSPKDYPAYWDEV